MSKLLILNIMSEECIYIVQSEGFIEKGQEQKVSESKRSIYGLKKASISWNISFNQVISAYGFEQNINEPCVYKRIKDNVMISLCCISMISFSLRMICDH